MKSLIVEDDLTTRVLLQKLLERYGQCHIAVNGRDGVEAARAAMEAGKPYDLICLDIMMPDLDGHAVLKEIRGMEEARGIVSADGAKIVMTTGLADANNVKQAIRGQCSWYLIKPIKTSKLVHLLEQLKLIGPGAKT